MGQFSIGDPGQFCIGANTNMVAVRSGGHSFTLGPQTRPADPSGRPGIYFIPEPHEVSFTVSRSILGCPTPFEFNFLSRTRWWKRYVDYRLDWTKRSGAELAMYWRYEQDYFTGKGWTQPAMMWNFKIGCCGRYPFCISSTLTPSPKPFD